MRAVLAEWPLVVAALPTTLLPYVGTSRQDRQYGALLGVAVAVVSTLLM